MLKNVANRSLFLWAIFFPTFVSAAGFSFQHFVWANREDSEVSIRQMVAEAVDALSARRFLVSGPEDALAPRTQIASDGVAAPASVAMSDDLREEIIRESIAVLRASSRTVLLERLSYWSKEAVDERFVQKYFGSTSEHSKASEVYILDLDGRFSIVKDQRSRAALRLAAAGAKSAIPLLQEAWHREPSQWARMMYEYALAVLGETSVKQTLFNTLLSSPYQTFFLRQSEHPVPLTTARRLEHFDGVGIDADPFTVALLGLSQADLTDDEAAMLKDFVKQYLGELLSESQMDGGVLIRQPANQVLTDYSVNFVEGTIQSLVASAAILDHHEVYDLVAEHFRAIGHIVGHNPRENRYNPPVFELTAALLALDESKALHLINEKLKEIDSVMVKGPRKGELTDPINSKDPYFRFMYLDHRILEAVKKQAPILLKERRVFEVTPYRTHYGLHVISSPNQANTVMREHNKARWHDIRDPRITEAAKKGLLAIFDRADIGGVVDKSDKKASCASLMIEGPAQTD